MATIYCNADQCKWNVKGVCEEEDVSVSWNEKIDIPVCDNFKEDK